MSNAGGAPEEIRARLTGVTYISPMPRTRLTIEGMLSVHAVRAVSTALGGVEGVLRADVAMGRATVDHDGRVRCEALAEAVAMAGFTLRGCEDEPRRLPVL